MHEENEHGVAAHWMYQERKKELGNTAKKITDDVKWVEQLKQWQEKYSDGTSDPDELLQSMKIDFFKDRIFVITPKGDVLDLPAGATPVDFAYYIHSEIGNTCVGAKVNGAIVPLDHKLHSGDLVEIIVQKGKKPSGDWLDFVKTSIAREHIKYALREKHKIAKEASKPTKAELKIVTEGRVGLIKDISTVIANSHINIIAFEVKNQPGNRFPVDRVEIALTDKQKIEKIILKIKQIKGVKEVGYKLV